jgi:hypothetical protein
MRADSMEQLRRDALDAKLTPAAYLKEAWLFYRSIPLETAYGKEWFSYF